MASGAAAFGYFYIWTSRATCHKAGNKTQKTGNLILNLVYILFYFRFRIIYSLDMEKARKIYARKSHGTKIIIFAVIVLAAIQVWFLYYSYKEVATKMPAKLFASPKPFPVTELIPNTPYVPSGEENNQAAETEEETPELSAETISAVTDASGDTGITAAETTTGEFVLTEVQKKIVLRLMELLEKDIEYGYTVYPDSGYPPSNTWISTDVVAIVLRDAGYDLMELIYKDMTEHKEDYPMDIKKRSEPIKYIDFRDVFFQEKFFKRNALELDKQYILGNENNNIQWQPGDIVFFQFDPDNPYQDLAGFVSSRKNNEGVPLVIMISKDLGRVSEVDALLDYIIVGHYRYPNPYEEG